MFTRLAAGFAMLGMMSGQPGGALAENAEGFEQRYGGYKIDLNRRFPGDRAIGDGHARTMGPDQGPYVERCHWIARDTFFGLPWGFTQRCQRYTLENTE